ncbi:MAG: copper-binding protein [Betaproteobacteria bacterium]
MTTSTSIAVVIACLVAALPVSAQTGTPPTTPVVAPTSSTTVDAEVRKVDTDTGKITLKHGPIPNLDMPGMTMIFRVKDPAMLDKVKAGDKVRFTADKVGGLYTIMSIESAK